MYSDYDGWYWNLIEKISDSNRGFARFRLDSEFFLIFEK